MAGGITGTPWHVDFLYMQEGDVRRDRRRCVFFRAGKCNCSESKCFMLGCMGSSHCGAYSEDKTCSRAETNTANEKREENRKAEAESKATTLLAENRRRFQNISFTIADCPVCGARLQHGRTVRKCGYCKALFVQAGKNEEDNENAFVLKGENKEKATKTEIGIAVAYKGTIVYRTDIKINRPKDLWKKKKRKKSA